MRIAAIDPGSRGGVGFALLQLEGLQLLDSAAVHVQLPAHSHDKTPLWRAITKQLDAFNLTHDDVIAYEQVIKHSSVYAAHLYGGQVAIIQQYGSYLGLHQSVPVPVATVKRFLQSRAAGKDKAKAQVEAARRLGYNVINDHNAADALGVALGAAWLMKRSQ